MPGSIELLNTYGLCYRVPPCSDVNLLITAGVGSQGMAMGRVVAVAGRIYETQSTCTFMQWRS
jgi:hypothetical protein